MHHWSTHVVYTTHKTLFKGLVNIWRSGHSDMWKICIFLKWCSSDLGFEIYLSASYGCNSGDKVGGTIITHTCSVHKLVQLENHNVKGFKYAQ